MLDPLVSTPCAHSKLPDRWPNTAPRGLRTLCRRGVVAWLFPLALGGFSVPPLLAGPTVVPTASGQIGEVPAADTELVGGRLESIRGNVNDVIFGGIFIPGGAVPPPPEASFLTDEIHGYPDPVPIGSTELSVFNIVAKQPPSISRTRKMADDGDFVAFSFALDGSAPETFTVRIATFDENGTSQVEVPIENIPTFPLADPVLTKTGVAVDNQGRVTVAYSELSGGVSNVLANRYDSNGAPLNTGVPVVPTDTHLSPDVALLDPAGNRMIVVTTDLVNPAEIFGNIIDFSGGTPVVLPEFMISDTPAPLFGNVAPIVAADPTTGDFTVVWEHVTTNQGDPIDVRGRRFDAMGNPIGGDFRVNTTTANTQAQPFVTYAQDGTYSAVAWAGDSGVQGDELDVFLQVYDAQGVPVDGEIRVNTVTSGVQDRPSVVFLPETDILGQPQVLVTWRDVGLPDGTQARGTGQSYKCFSIGGEDPTVIFADGFESGDTTSWSDQQP